MSTLISRDHGRKLLSIAGGLCSAALILGGCFTGSADTEPANEANEEADSVDLAATTYRPLDRASGTKLRVAVWNTNGGSVFPYSDAEWKQINTRPNYRELARVAGAKDIFRAMDADVWLLQEVIYGDSAPSNLSTLNSKIRTYMGSVLSGSSWSVDCNGRGLCTMIRTDRGLSLQSKCNNKARATGHLVKVNSTPIVLSNLHYVGDGQEGDTVEIIKGSKAAAYLVAGDFNGGPTSIRVTTVGAIPMSKLTLLQGADPGATHLSSTWKSTEVTHGSTLFATDSSKTKALVSGQEGSQLDHFFVKNFTVKKSALVNTMLWSKETLAYYGVPTLAMSPLAVAAQPDTVSKYFTSFATTGKVSPSLVSDGKSHIGHDHLPMFADLSFTDSTASSSLTCAK